MLGWSVSLGRIGGTAIRLHVTFILIVLWLAVSAWLRAGPAAALDAVAFFLGVFACILLHEGGHAMAARAYGISTRDITLLPIGGVATIERMPEKPHQELLVALAGPAVNLVIAFLLLAASGGKMEVDFPRTEAGLAEVDFAVRLAFVNLGLALFNMIPAFPMDGGRALRALLAFRLDRARATRISARIGQGVAFFLGFVGLFGNPILLFVALFVFLAATHETLAIELGEATKGVSMTDAAITHFESLGADTTIAQAAERLLASAQRDFPVTDLEGRLMGVLTHDGIIKALKESGPNTPVPEAMERNVPTINRRAPLSEAVALMQAGSRPLVAMVDDSNRVIGLVTFENLAEYLMLTHARHEWPHSRSALT